MTAVVTGSCPGTQETTRPESFASSQSSSSWQSGSLVSASYLHKLIVLYLRINADEVLSARLQNWKICSCDSGLSHADGEKLSSPCDCGQEYSAEGEGRRTKSEVAGGKLQQLCCCASVWDPKTTAEADAEFCALRSHLLQYASPGRNPGVDQTECRQSKEKRAVTQRQDLTLTPRTAAGDGSSRSPTLAGAELRVRCISQDKTRGGACRRLDAAQVARGRGVDGGSRGLDYSESSTDDRTAAANVLGGPGMMYATEKSLESGVRTPGRCGGGQGEPTSTSATDICSFPLGCESAVDPEEDVFRVSSGGQSVVLDSLAGVVEDRSSEPRERDGRGSRLVDRGLMQRARSDSASVLTVGHNSAAPAADPSSPSTRLGLVPHRASLVGGSPPCSPPSTCVSLSSPSVSDSIPMWQWSSRSLPLRRLSRSAVESPATGGAREDEGQSPANPLYRMPLSVSASPFGSLPSRFSPRMASRIYVDGVFDLLHSGHFNALRQARQLGDQLVVGVNSDFATLVAKNCRPIYTETERAEIVRGCKWVDEVVVGTPYEVSVQLLDRLHCGFAAHGDDWVAGADGRDAYAEPRAAGRMKIFKRTEGISTSTIVSRLLQATANIERRNEKAGGTTQAVIIQPTRVQRFARDSLREQKCCACASRRREDVAGGEVSGQKREEEGRTTTMESSSGGGSPMWSSSSSEGEVFQSAAEGHPGRLRREGDCSGSCADVTAATSVASGKRKAGGAHAEGTGAGGRSGGCCASHLHVRRDAEERRMLMSTKRLLQFIGQPKKPKKGDKIVYVDGSFDVFHGKGCR